MNRRCFLLGAIATCALLAAGCGGNAPPTTFGDAIRITEETLYQLLVSPADQDATRNTRPDPPLLKKGTYETALIAVDAEGFVRVSRGALSTDATRELQTEVVKRLNERLEKRGFSARAVPFGTDVKGEARALLATLTPTTQEGGSPKDRAEGKAETYVLVRLTVTDPASGAVLRQRDYYSGSNVKKEGRRRS